MATELTGVLLDVERNTVEKKVVDGSPNDFFEVLNCGYVRVITRTIGGRSFYIVCDEALNQWDDEPMVYGNIFIAGIGEDEDLASLNDTDYEHVMSYIKPDGYRLHSTSKK